MNGPRRVLVTGAGGFIGGRVVEVLWRLSDWEPRAGLRVWSNGARVGRMPVEISKCDILEPDEVREAVSGVDAVVHCAVGAGEVIVRGTENVLRAALDEEVERFVHLSTVDVYGKPTGAVSEEHPLERTSKDYGNLKIEAEDRCREYLGRGLPVSVLRPSIVYGPFCEEWVVNFVRRLQAGRRPVPRENAEGTCNLLYVDDLVDAIRAALVRDEAVGEAFNVNGPERDLTWNDYFTALQEAIGSNARAPDASRSRLRAGLMMPVRDAAKAVLDRFEDPIMAVYKRYRPARSLMKTFERMIRNTPTTSEFRLYDREVSYRTGKAEQMIDFRPRYTMEDGVALTAGWLDHHGYVPAS